MDVVRYRLPSGGWVAEAAALVGLPLYVGITTVVLLTVDVVLPAAAAPVAGWVAVGFALQLAGIAGFRWQGRRPEPCLQIDVDHRVAHSADRSVDLAGVQRAEAVWRPWRGWQVRVDDQTLLQALEAEHAALVVAELAELCGLAAPEPRQDPVPRGEAMQVSEALDGVRVQVRSAPLASAGWWAATSVLLLPLGLSAAGVPVVWLAWLLLAGLIAARLALWVLQPASRPLELWFTAAGMHVDGRRFALARARVVPGAAGPALGLLDADGHVLWVRGQPLPELRRLEAWAHQVIRATGAPGPIPDALIRLRQAALVPAG